MNSKEKNFINSIRTKIKKYSIPITVKEALELAGDKFIETQYNDNSTEVVDAHIEYEFCRRSPYYFISKYGFIHFPGIGIIPYNLYYFQKEILKDTNFFKKLVFLKTRQAGISTLFSLYAFWLGNFHESENIDVVSIKQKKAHAFTKKMFPTMDRLPSFLKTPLLKKNMSELEWANGSYMLSESASDKAGRGDSLSLLILDELAFYRSDALTRGIVSAAQPTLTRTGGQQVLISCVTEDTYIFTDNGIMQMKDFITDETTPGFNPIPLFRIEGLASNQVCNLFYDSGESDTIKITTKLGFEVEGTDVHPVFVRMPNGECMFKRLKGIQKKDQVIIKHNIQCFGNNEHFAGKKLNKSVAYVLGNIVSKGKLNKLQDTISFPYRRKDWFKLKRFCCAFDAKMSVDGGEVHLFSSKMVEELRISGLFLDRLPSEFLKMNETLSHSFIKGFCFGKCFIGIRSKKTEMMKQIQMIMLNLGMVTRRTNTTLTSADEHEFRIREYLVDEVISVERRKNRHTYDFYIPKTNTFLTNGIVSHNTPNGMSGPGSYYAEQVQQLQILGGQTETEKLITIDWYEVPDMEEIDPKKGFNDVIDNFIKQDYYRREKVKQEMKKFFKPIGDNPKANPFLKKQLDDLGPILYRQEIEHDFVVSGDQVFPEEVLDKVKERVREPEDKNMLGRTRVNGLYIWKHPVPKRRYILGADTSTSTGREYSSIQVLDVENYEQVAEYKGHLATKTFGKLIKKVARYYNEAFTVIECNSIGEAVFNEVYYSEEEPYKNVYKQKKTGKDGQTRMTGWETNVKTRQLMINNLIDYFTVDELFAALHVYSDRLYKEMLSFVWINGKAVHSSNGFDDILIALGLCLYFRGKANTVGESFLISEDGEIIGTDDESEISEVKLKESGVDDVAFSEDVEFEDEFGMSKEEYDWLIG